MQIIVYASAVGINILATYLRVTGRLPVEWYAIVGTTAWLALLKNSCSTNSLQWFE